MAGTEQFDDGVAAGVGEARVQRPVDLGRGRKLARVACGQGEILAGASTFRFDGSDLMPGKIGAGAFWTGMVDLVGGKSAQDVATDIQKAWDGIK